MNIPNCVICSNPLFLITQIYAPIQDSVFHRFIAVFACNQSECSIRSKSWMAYRILVPDLDYLTEERLRLSKESNNEVSNAAKANSNLFTLEQEANSNLFTLEQDNDWDVDDFNDLLNQTENLLIDTKVESKNTIEIPSLKSNHACFDAYYMYTEIESCSKTNENLDHELKLLKEYQEREGILKEPQWSNESYESEPKIQKEFKNFQKKLTLNPTQCIRY